MRERLLKGSTALITGASSGLGLEFAKQLAQAGCDLVLTARSTEPMLQLKEKLEAEYGVKTTVIPRDLALTDAGASLYERIISLGLKIDVLVNNAGVGLYGEFLEQGWEKMQDLLQLDIVAPVQLTKLFAKDMAERGAGKILMVSSIGGYQPCPLYAVYGAAKSFILDFGVALNYELRGTGVSCTVLSPGVTSTNFLKTAGQKPSYYQRALMMESSDVVKAGIKAMIRGRSSVIPGWPNAFSAWVSGVLPRRFSAFMAYMLMKQGS